MMEGWVVFQHRGNGGWQCIRRGESWVLDDVSSAGLVQVTTSQDGVWKLPSACPVDSPSHPNNEGRQLESRHAIQLWSQRLDRPSARLLFLYTLLYIYTANIPWQPFYVWILPSFLSYPSSKLNQFNPTTTCYRFTGHVASPFLYISFPFFNPIVEESY